MVMERKGINRHGKLILEPTTEGRIVPALPSYTGQPECCVSLQIESECRQELYVRKTQPSKVQSLLHDLLVVRDIRFWVKV